MTSKESRTKIAVVGSSQEFAESLRFFMKEAGIEMTYVPSTPEAMSKIDEINPDVVMTDLRSDDSDEKDTFGIELIEQLDAIPIPSILMTNLSLPTEIRANLPKNSTVFEKGINPGFLPLIINDLLKDREA